MTSRRAVMLAGLSLGVLSVRPGFAQTPQPVRHLRGTIASRRGETLVIRTLDGGEAQVLMSGRTRVASVAPASLADLKKGDFIGTAATGPEDHLVARELVIFPAALRGMGEGHYPWDLGPRSTMTNATITSEARERDGRMLTLEYKGGQARVFVPPNAPVVALGPGSGTLLTPGAKVFVVASDQNGSLVAQRIVVGKNGLMPPM